MKKKPGKSSSDNNNSNNNNNNNVMDDDNDDGFPREDTPLLLPVHLGKQPSTASSTGSASDRAKENWRKLRKYTLTATGTFRRSIIVPQSKKQKSRRLSAGRIPIDDDDGSSKKEKRILLEPMDALAPLVAGGVITTTTTSSSGDGSGDGDDGNGFIIKKTSEPRPPSSIKSLPAFAPFRRRARHRSFYLFWLNEFRHWWKSSRLLVRLAGLFTLATTLEFTMKMMDTPPYKHHHKRKATQLATQKLNHKVVKMVKKLGRGGPMRYFLQWVHPFTRTLRIIVAVWRWIESAQCRRGEVGFEEAMAFIGNRVSRMLARTAVDLFVLWGVMPIASHLFYESILPPDAWHPVVLFCLLGVARACAPFAASFQGSRAGRILTRQFFKNAKHRWQPLQRVKQLNLSSDDCCEQDEVSETADLAKLAKLVAKALGKSQQIGVDGMEYQSEALVMEGFRQVGAGSGGYAVYECHKQVISKKNNNNNNDDGEVNENEIMTILLHVTPFGPSILNVMPRYVVLEFEHSVDRRSRWSEFISQRVFEGPPVVEGYCYNGAFFSPHHFAELKETYDKQLLAYDSACRAMCRTSRDKEKSPNPPSDLLSLKAFLVQGKRNRTRKKNAREGRQLSKVVERVAKQLKGMMNMNKKKKTTTTTTTTTTSTATTDLDNDDDCVAPRGVILYFEGLDCSGKSSTGGLVEQALEQAGYKVDMRQYNRPPTAEQKKRPWMDRFEVPETSTSSTTTTATVATLTIPDGNDYDDETQQLLQHHHYPQEGTSSSSSNSCSGNRNHDHMALVWDRGPAGDFVYNPEYRNSSRDFRRDRYREFKAFDQECFEKGILFVKLLFVTNRDSIASTLGKRLAQKKMAGDLRTWLTASSGGGGGGGGGGIGTSSTNTAAAATTSTSDDLLSAAAAAPPPPTSMFEGLDAIEAHIDPTDFVAFNSYQTNLRIFTNFAMNTESQDNPWIVVNTGDRYSARKQLLAAFSNKLKLFQQRKQQQQQQQQQQSKRSSSLSSCCPRSSARSTSTGEEEENDNNNNDTPAMSEAEMLEQGFEKPLPTKVILALVGILFLIYYYCEHTKFDTLANLISSSPKSSTS